MAGPVQIDPDTGLPVFDPSTDPSTTGTTINSNPFRNGFAAGGAGGSLQGNGGQPFRIPNNGFGASAAVGMQRPNFATPNEMTRSRAYGGDPAGVPDPGGITTSDPGSGITDPGLFGGNSPAPTSDGPSVWDRVKSAFGGAYDNIHGAMPGSDPSLPPYGAARPDAPWGAQAPAGGGGGIGSDANFPLTGGGGGGGIGSDANFPLNNAQRGMPWAGNNGGQPAAGAPQRGMPWAGNNGGQPATPGGMPWAGNNGGQPAGSSPFIRARPGPTGYAPGSVNMGHGGGPVAAHPAIQAAAARAAAAQQTGQSPSSPFTWVMRPNASAQNGNAYPGSMNTGPRGGGGTPIMTALDLSHMFGGGQPAAAPAPVRTAPAPVRRAPVQGPLAKTALKRPAAAPAPYPVTETGDPTPSRMAPGSNPGQLPASTWGQQISDAAAAEGGLPGGPDSAPTLPQPNAHPTLQNRPGFFSGATRGLGLSRPAWGGPDNPYGFTF